jgi:hypothetical protein
MNKQPKKRLSRQKSNHNGGQEIHDPDGLTSRHGFEGLFDIYATRIFRVFRVLHRAQCETGENNAAPRRVNAKKQRKRATRQLYL